MASEEVRSLNEKIASDNLFKAKAVGEVQVGLIFTIPVRSLTWLVIGRNGCVQVWSMSAEEMYLLSNANEECG